MKLKLVKKKDQHPNFKLEISTQFLNLGVLTPVVLHGIIVYIVARINCWIFQTSYSLSCQKQWKSVPIFL